MARHQRNIDVAGFADGLAVIERFQHGEQARVFLDLPRQRIEIARATVAAKRGPAGERGVGRLHRGVDVALIGLGDLR